MKRGFTLMELLVAAVVVAIISLALVGAFGYGVSYQGRAESSRQAELEKTHFEDRLRTLLQNATTSTDAGDTSLFFLAGLDATGADERITFTTIVPRINGAQLVSQDDFETQNIDFGPQGGPQEISIGLTPVGQTNTTSGLFLRQQRPADGDWTQGGMESVIQPNVTSIRWDLFDGLNWQTTWDTAQTNRRIPSAARVTYRLDGDETEHVFVVRLYKSDVTPENPVTVTATGATS
jgi:prepilin-type N-terminal cleavage/methylation domain-containing protein